MALFLKGTITSTKDLEADGLYLVVSLSGDKSNKKQRTTVSTKGITWSGRTFELLVGDLGTLLEFKIEASTFPLEETVVGEVDVLVMDLLQPVWDLFENGCVGDMKPNVLSLLVRSSSPKTKGKTMGVLEFSYKFGQRFLVEAPPESYAPPMPRPLMAYEQNAAPPPAMNTSETATGYQQTAAPNYQAALPPPSNTGVTVGYAVGVPSTFRPPLAYEQNAAPPPPLIAAVIEGYPVGAYWPSTPRPQPAYPHNGAACQPIPEPVHHTAYQHNWAAYLPPHHQTAYLPNATPTDFYGAPAGYGPAAPQPPRHRGRNFLGRLGRGFAVSAIMSCFNNLGFDAGDSADAGF